MKGSTFWIIAVICLNMFTRDYMITSHLAVLQYLCNYYHYAYLLFNIKWLSELHATETVQDIHWLVWLFYFVCRTILSPIGRLSITGYKIQEQN